MKTQFSFWAALFLILPLLNVSCTSTGQNRIIDATTLMCQYLIRQIDPETGLCTEHPNDEKPKAWIWSDNFLASLALGDDRLAALVNSFDVPRLEKFVPLKGDYVSEEWFAIPSGDKPLVVEELDHLTVQSEYPDTSIRLPDWQEYVDRLLLASINASNDNNPIRATELFNLAATTYDGVGLLDKAAKNNGEYSTYKLALYLIAAERLHVDRPEIDDMITTILSLQERNSNSNRYGGIYTEYSVDRKPFLHTDTNTETTALCLMASQSYEDKYAP